MRAPAHQPLSLSLVLEGALLSLILGAYIILIERPGLGSRRRAGISKRYLTESSDLYT